jgi:lipopolysaccharide transport system permease protein
LSASLPTQSDITRIRPSKGWIPTGLGELWAYRDLLYFLTWRDAKVRYKQTVIGAGWVILQPVLAVLVFSIVFGKLVDVPSQGAPYPVFVFAALVPWTFVSTGVALAAMSLVENEQMLTKVYFPRVAMPAAAVLACILDFLISFVALAVMMLVYDVAPPLTVLTLPIFAVLAVLTALAVSLWLSAANVLYRDVRYALPFLLQIWLFISPVVFASDLVPERWRMVFALNPMAGVIDGFRWCLLEGADPPGPELVVSLGVLTFLLAGGLIYFARMQRSFADSV